MYLKVPPPRVADRSNTNDRADRGADLSVDLPLGPALMLVERFAHALGSNGVGLRRGLV